MKVTILALPGASLGGFAATVDVLEAANRLRLDGDPLFDWRLVSPNLAAELRFGVSLDAAPLAGASPGDWVVVLGLGSAGPEEVARRLERQDVAAAARWLRAANASGSRIAAACTGVFLLAEAGLLGGRDCTTSWWLQGLLARRAPEARIRPDAMVVAADPLWTAGPAYAQLDLMLAVLAQTASPDLARRVGGRLSADRRSSQGSYVDPRAMGPSPLLATLEQAVNARLSEQVVLADLASSVGCSPRTLARRVRSETGLSPMRFVQKIKLQAALRLIEEGSLTLGQVAGQIGLADGPALHRLTVRHTGRAPGTFRKP